MNFLISNLKGSHSHGGIVELMVLVYLKGWIGMSDESKVVEDVCEC